MSITGIGTHIKVANFKKSVAFYEALGFKKVFEFGPDKLAKENYSGITFEHGGCKLEVADGHIAVKPHVFGQRMASSKMSLMIYVDTLSEVVDLAKKADIEIAVAPRHYHWGTLELVIKDPDGVVLVFIAPYSQDEAKQINADETWVTPSA